MHVVLRSRGTRFSFVCDSASELERWALRVGGFPNDETAADLSCVLCTLYSLQYDMFQGLVTTKPIDLCLPLKIRLCRDTIKEVPPIDLNGVIA